MFRTISIITFLLFVSHGVFSLPFVDVSISAGLIRDFAPVKKFGGAVVCDLDGDGWPDLIFGHHDNRTADIYYSNKDGTFSRANWRHWNDIHAFAPFRRSPYTRTLSFIMSVGGNYGRQPRPPRLYNIGNDRIIYTLPELDYAYGRGRGVIVASLRPKPIQWTDLIFMNAAPLNSNEKRNFAATFSNKLKLLKRDVSILNGVKNPYGVAVDVNMDGLMEIFMFHKLQIFQVVGYFQLKEITKSVLPSNLWNLDGVISVSEFDYDNDGLMDVYIARSVTNDVRWLERVIGPNPNDILLRNVGGKYVDVSREAGIPKGGESRGVTAGDFNNDGFIDLFVSQYTGRDRLLINNGDGTFSDKNPGFSRSSRTRGDQAVAVDYDRNGQMDLIVSEGDYFFADRGGYFKIMKNIGNNNNWILFRIGSSPSWSVSSMHALVSILSGSRRQIRRVGSPGTATGTSYIEMIHFGLGGNRWVREAKVTWSDGTSETKERLRGGQIYSFGKLPSV